jgi:hypothetical protein
LKRGPILLVLAALAFAPAAHAGGPTIAVGAAEDNVRQPTVTASKAQMDLLRLLGLNAVRVTTTWSPGLTTPGASEAGALSVVDQAAKLSGLTVYVQVMNAGSKTTPLPGKDQHDFAAYAVSIAKRFSSLRNFVIGNEPNLNRFWLPQFGPNGEDVAAQSFELLLAQTYDALKAVSPDVTVWGGAISPRGEDKPNSSRPTHSPTQFILDLGIAYRGSGRSTPIMDGIALHPYEDYSSLPPSFQHPKTTTIALADYAKLIGVLGQAFDGTAQLGTQLPVLYDEFGVESQIPADKASLYTGTEPVSTHAVDEATQAKYYYDALSIAFCQPNVRGFFFFHTADEQALDRWQSGIYYVDGSKKSGFDTVRTAVRASRGGTLARCPGLQLTPVPALAVPPTKPFQHAIPAVTVTCDIDCNLQVRLERLPNHATVAAIYAKGLAGAPVPVQVKQRRLARAQYRFTIRATAPVNVGPPGTANSRAFTLG